MSKNNIEAERAIIGTAVISEDAVPEIMSLLQASDFTSAANAHIFTAISDLFNHGSAIDPVTVINELTQKGKVDAAGGIEYVVGISNDMPSQAMIPDYCQIVKDRRKKINLARLGKEIVGRAQGIEDIQALIDDFGTKFFELAADRNSQASMIGDLSRIQFQKIKDRYTGNCSELADGLKTGLNDLDKIIVGLQGGDLIILAGRPSMGKTSLAMNIGLEVADRGGRVFVFSLEMSADQLTERLFSSRSKVSLHAIRKGLLNETTLRQLELAANEIESLSLDIDDSAALSLTQVRAKAKMAASRNGMDLLVVDYLGLMSDKADNREREISQITAGLKAIAKELNIPVIALSQLNRGLEQRSNKRPVLSDLRDSGSIEQDADVVIFVYRDEVYNPSPQNPEKGMAELIIAKHRNGPTGTIRVNFDGQYCLFSDNG